MGSPHHTFTVAIDDGPTDLKRIAECGQMFRWSPLPSGWLIQDGNEWYEVGEVENGRLVVTTNTSEKRFQSLFRLEMNHENMLQQMVKLGPELRPHIESLKGLRMMRPGSTVETLFSFLCTSNNHISRITSMVNTLASFGQKHEQGFKFPAIEVIASISEADLRSKGFGYRGASIPVAAKQLAERGGETYLESLKTTTYEYARNELLTLKGVGPKLADCICLFGFDYGAAVPIDTHIWQAMTRLYFPEWKETSLTHKKYDQAADFLRHRFGDLAGAAHQFLFVDNLIHWRERKALETDTNRT